MGADGYALEEALVLIDAQAQALGIPSHQPIVVDWYVLQALDMGRTLLRVAKQRGLTTPEQFNALRRQAKLDLQVPIPPEEPQVI